MQQMHMHIKYIMPKLYNIEDRLDSDSTVDVYTEQVCGKHIQSTLAKKNSTSPIHTHIHKNRTCVDILVECTTYTRDILHPVFSCI